MILIYTCVPLAFILMTLAVCINFIDESNEQGDKIHQKSPVDTFTMYGVVAMMYASFVLGQSGVLPFLKFEPLLGLQILGTFLVYGGIGVNLMGRFALKNQWSNMIKIKRDHAVIQTGVFRYIRHPLYASTMWVLLGAGLIYSNSGIIVLLLVVFYPMMVYRSKQEEVVLLTLEGYKHYQERTGRFFPKWKWRRGESDENS